MARLHTFVRFSAAFLRWCSGDRAHRLTSLMAGLLPDMLADAARATMRFSLPLVDTPLDALPHLLKHFGLPTYDESYAATLLRLRGAWATHVISGSQTMLETESVAAGLVNPAVVPLVISGDPTFSISADNVTAAVIYEAGGSVYGGGFVYGNQCDVAGNVGRMIHYFKPARERFTGLTP